MKHILYNISGACYASLGQLDAAVKCYEKALAINPDYAEAHNNLGNALRRLGKLDASVKSYKKAIAIKSDYAGSTVMKLLSLYAINTHQICFYVKVRSGWIWNQ